MKYLPGGPMEKPGSGGGMIFLFIPGGGRTDKGSHSIPSPGTGSSGKTIFRSMNHLSFLCPSTESRETSKQFEPLAI
jgi:hypothetical protein